MATRTVVALRHVAFEDLGSFAGPIERAGYAIRYHDAGIDDLARIDPLEPDLLVMLGGPIGAYEEAAYPFLRDELALLERRLRADRPTLGICLGAQLMARALKANVYPGPGKEIGWAPVTLSEAGHAGPLRHLGEAPVLHWHGDTFDLPEGCDRLASTAICPNQAFARGPNLLGLQFHPEARGATFEQWLIGHACELGAAGLTARDLRADADRHAADLETRAAALIGDWLEAL
jgi:GMP synthase (glutamine-hydrolysing)